MTLATEIDTRDGLCTIDGTRCYRVSDVDRMPPFLMSVVSDTDLWMFLSSTGGLTAGRVNEDGAIFPYETDDKLHDRHGVTGPLTLLRVGDEDDGAARLWEPFSPAAARPGERTLYKSLLGNRVIFEEVRPDLGLTLRTAWGNSERFGHVRTCTLSCELTAAGPARIELLDGLLNILPAGTDLGTQQKASCLINAYTQAELDAEAGLALFAMTSLIIDRAEPAEALRANVAWISGLPAATLSLATQAAVTAFRQGTACAPQALLTGRRGGLVARADFTLAPGESITWRTAVDAGLDHGRLAALRTELLGTDLDGRVTADLARGDAALVAIVAAADGVQQGGDEMATSHHFANVLFNVMRGGYFAQGHEIDSADLVLFVAARNHAVAAARAGFFAALPPRLPIADLLAAAARERSPDLLRLCYEYLPLTFSRRHGDPSRPWNRFAVRVKDEHGRRVLDYQGNWRDIFQNWEALCLSYPDFIESVIAKFVNVSTIDGFNPYRVTRAGIEWEVPEPHDPWANIGYWGDHQIAYLLRLLELSHRFHPGALEKLLDQPVFSYANVPYRLKSYEELVKDRWNTIDFDADLDRAIAARVAEAGTDAKLLGGEDGTVHHVTLLEKLLVTLLSKLSNFVIGGGIWMNTQRPEWNDANNALVGSGVSVVTLCHVRRYIAFFAQLLAAMKPAEGAISLEVREWFSAVADTLASNEHLLRQPVVSDADRKRVLDELGNAFSTYRTDVYARGFSGIGHVTHEALREFLESARHYVDHTLHVSRRPGGLYHSYNLLEFTADGNEVAVSPLYEMLEGQVAALASGALNAIQAVDLVEALFESKLYRPDQNSFMLYPDRALPRFAERNVVPPETVAANGLLRALLEEGDRSVITRDTAGVYRFASSFRNAPVLAAALDRLEASGRFAPLVAPWRAATLEAYEAVFNHRSFTGRSGTMYGYEGLGCIYWHMVSKLLLAVQENYQAAERSNQPASIRQTLADLYYRVRGGLGFNKTAGVYGAVPTDPYSHTPRHAGAQQPGMTGQVKEEILTRAGELGLCIEDGRLHVRPGLLRTSEFTGDGTLSFTFCGTRFVYRVTDGEAPPVEFDRDATRQITARRGERAAISVVISRSSLRAP